MNPPAKPRIDPFTTVHKAVRARLFDHAMMLARADFREESECRRVAGQTHDLLFTLQEHADHEDVVMFPAILDRAPELFAEAHRQHEALDGKMRELERLSLQAVLVTPSERLEVGTRLRVAFYDFVAMQLTHLAMEESDLTRALWDSCTDEELLAMRGRIQARMTPERQQLWVGYMFDAGDPMERAFLGAA